MTRFLPEALLTCWACGASFSMRAGERIDRPRTRICSDCIAGKNQPQEWYVDEDEDTERALEEASRSALTTEQKMGRALAILSLELSKVDKARAFSLLTAYEEFQSPEIADVLRAPREYLQAMMGRGPRPERPQDVEHEVKAPLALPEAPHAD